MVKMKRMKIKYIILAISLFFVSTASAQNEKFEHRLVVGYNFGATSPLPLPAEVRSVETWHPLFTPQIGYELRYALNDPTWKIGTGLQLDIKGMVVRDKVKYMYTRVSMNEEGEPSRTLSGYFVGKNKTKVLNSYLTLPVYVIKDINAKWNVRAGGYVAYAYSKKFNGNVSDGYMLPVDDETNEVDVKTEISHADFNFGEDIRNFDFGVLAGTEMRINPKMTVYGTLNWGLTSIFPSNYKPVSFKMYNIYLSLGITRKL